MADNFFSTAKSVGEHILRDRAINDLLILLKNILSWYDQDNEN